MLCAYQSTRRLGAYALNLSYVAAGWLGATMELTFKPWDVAVGIHILRVAGGTALNVDTGSGMPDGLRSALVASGNGFDATTAQRVLEEALASVDHTSR
ncbi:inositol monophosphatase family protein [Schaalia vaccimaxillae]|uniref:inositol monophosphatase family protein n=1 Tax=Schaalia vaccimaxillae TaxID=183916 RepID=UPI0003B73E18|nr:inositol monophosphatase family protein [Schaalia vaccimaxillae]